MLRRRPEPPPETAAERNRRTVAAWALRNRPRPWQAGDDPAAAARWTSLSIDRMDSDNRDADEQAPPRRVSWWRQYLPATWKLRGE